MGGDFARGLVAHRLSLVYRTSMKPWLVADLLILRPEMPRSLISCYESIVRNLDSLARAHAGREQRSVRRATCTASSKR